MEVHPGRFDVDGEFGPLDGYTAGQTWEGWACPYFTPAVATQIATFWQQGILSATFDGATDTYTFRDPENDGGKCYRVEGEDHTYAGQTLHLYSIGHRYWCWVETA